MSRRLFSPEEVRTIRAAYGLRSLAHLAKLYGVSHVTIWNICRGGTYPHVNQDGAKEPLPQTPSPRRMKIASQGKNSGLAARPSPTLRRFSWEERA